MAKYIDADRLRSEIEIRIDATINIHHIHCHRREELEGLLSSIDSLQPEQSKIEEDWVEKRKQECGCRKLLANGNYQCERYEGSFGPCDGRCSWVVDYPKLKGLEKQQEMDLEKIIEQTYHDGSVADTDDMDHIDFL